MKAELKDEKVVVEGTELFTDGWYGKKVGSDTVIGLVEACLLMERGRLEIDKFDFKKFFQYCAEKDKRFTTRFLVYRDLRERGLPVRMGFKDCDFRVYERGAKKKADSIKWIVFVQGEDYDCQLELFGKMNKLSKNIRAEAMFAVVDNDTDVTYYKVSELAKL
jgi:tRNA-intron endonuclease, archaea type